MLRRTLPLYLAITGVFCWPLFAAPTGTGILDWDQHFFLYAAVAKSYFAFHQLPFWNPWYCGGNMLWQNPEVAILSPAYLFSLAMPLQRAMQWNIALHVFAGLVGMDVLTRRSFGLTAWPVRAFLAVVFACGGSLAMHIGVGHATFLTFYYLPWLLHAALAAARAADWRQAARPVMGGGLAIALSAWNGGIYPVVMTGFALAVFGLAGAIISRNVRPCLVMVLIGLAGGAYAAPKLVPIAAALVDARLLDARPDLREPDSMTWTELKDTFVHPGRPADWVGYFEYGNYIGLAAGLLFIAVLGYWLLARPSRDRWVGVGLASAAALLLLLTAGTFSEYAPYTLLREWPVFSSLRKPGRYTIIFVLFAAAATAEALRQALRAPLSPALARIGAAVLLLAGADVVWHNRGEFGGALAQPPYDLDLRLGARTPAPAFDATSDGFGSTFAMMSGIATNRDIIRCHILLAPVKTVRPDLPIVHAQGAELGAVDFTPNRITVHARTHAAGRVSLNQNYITGWHASAGRFSVDAATGQASTVLVAGFDGPVTFRYRPPGIVVGTVVWLLALAVSGWAWRRSSATTPGLR